MNSKASSKTTIDTIISSYYGADPLSCDALTVEWAAARLADVAGETVGAKSWKRLNARRSKLGKYTTIPRYKSRLWDAYWA